jgi:adenylate cyclase
LAIVCTLLVAGLEWIAFLPTNFKALPDWEARALDGRAVHGRLTPPNTNLVFLAITQTAYADVPLEQDPDAQRSWPLQAMRESYPWNRGVWAEVIDRVVGAGARVVGFDLLFLTQGAGDAELRAALERHRDKVVIGSMFNYTGDDQGGGFQVHVPAATVLPASEDRSTAFDPRVGYVNFLPAHDGDIDGVIRHVRFRISEPRLLRLPPGEPYFESITARMLRQAGLGDRVPPDEAPRRFRFTGAPGEQFTPIPVNEIFYPHLWSNNFAGGEFFRDKIVLVGPAASVFQDAHRTPFAAAYGDMLGAEIHLHVLNAAIHGEFIRELSLGWRLAWDGFIGIVAVLLAVFVPQPVRRNFCFLGSLIVLHLVAGAAYDQAGIALTSIAPTIVLVLSGFATYSYDFVSERLARLKLRTTMGLYFSPKVMEAVLSDPGSMEPREAHVTLLLTDLRNSTPLAEKLGPKGMFDLLNRVFEVETAAVMGEEGNLEHFLGDQFLSYWGAPQAQPDAADRALRAAFKLIDGMDRLRESLSPEIKELFGYGVALHSGLVLVGNKGSAQRLDYGLVGDTVNAAARLESLTKFYGVRFLVSGDFLAGLQAPPPTRRLDVVIVKGKTQPLELHEMTVGTPDEATRRFHAAYEQAFKAYEAGRFSEAVGLFERLAAERSDLASKVLYLRCCLLEQDPPPQWVPVWEMDRK